MENSPKGFPWHRPIPQGEGFPEQPVSDQISEWCCFVNLHAWHCDDEEIVRDPERETFPPITTLIIITSSLPRTPSSALLRCSSRIARWTRSSHLSPAHEWILFHLRALWAMRASERACGMNRVRDGQISSKFTPIRQITFLVDSYSPHDDRDSYVAPWVEQLGPAFHNSVNYQFPLPNLLSYKRETDQ